MRGVTANMCENHLHQLHVCMPSKKGHTRLLYRMSLDFIPWVRYIPGIDRVWKSVAGQVLGEDLCLVAGQQDRLGRGGNTWANPVSYDKLAVRYRRWRNSVAAAGAGGSSSISSSREQEGGGRQEEDFMAPISMSAGAMFAPEEDADMYVDQQ
jgi:chlorophyllide a oxygenase